MHTHVRLEALICLALHGNFLHPSPESEQKSIELLFSAVELLSGLFDAIETFEVCLEEVKSLDSV